MASATINEIHGSGPVDDVYSSLNYNSETDILTVTGTASVGAIQNRGINDAGGEFGAPGPTASPHSFSNQNSGTHGTNYKYSTTATYDWYNTRGMKLIRLPFRWERVQPTLNGALDATEIGRIRGVCDLAEARGMKVILDVHNYGGYWLHDAGLNQGVKRALGSTELPYSAFADLWSRMATEFNAHNAVIGYGLMNEPIGLPTVGGGYTAETTRYTFDASNEAWNGATHDTTLFYAGGGSVFRSATFGAGWSQTTIGSPTFTARAANTGGATYSTWVYVPDSAPATPWLGRIRLRKPDFTWIEGPDVTLTRGQWSQITFTPTGADATADIHMIGLLAGSTDANATVQINFDEVTQGTESAGTAPAQVWEAASQAAADAIRAVDTDTYLVVGGYQYSDVRRFEQHHSAGPWITDPNDKVLYEAHHYWDNNDTGQYPHTYADGVADAEAEGYVAGTNADALITRIREDLALFTTWLTTHNAKGIMGEVGWPGDHAVAVAEATAWNGAGEAWYDDCDTNELWVTYWAAAEWFPNYNLAAYVHAGGTNGVLDQANSQATVIEAHL